ASCVLMREHPRRRRPKERDRKAATSRPNDLSQVGELIALQGEKNEEIVWAISDRVACDCAKCACARLAVYSLPPRITKLSRSLISAQGNTFIASPYPETPTALSMCPIPTNS